MQRRRRSVLIVLAVALALALVPHPRQREGVDHHKQYLAVAQEVHHGHFPSHAGHATGTGPLDDEEWEAKLAEVENGSVSLTLLGCVAFVMTTFYLVNWPDEDIQMISLEVINSTISIFGALLLFHSLQELLEHYMLPELDPWQEVAVSMVQMLLWFALLQLVLAYYSGALGQNEAVMLRSNSRAVADACGSPRAKKQLLKKSDKYLGVVKLNTEAWGILLGHTTGFAAKNACSTLQQAVPRHFVFVAFTPLLFLVMISLIYRATEFFRYKKTMADGEEDEFEHLWRHRTAETEDEVIALAVSFSICQMFRYGISGHMPNYLGEDSHNFSLHSNWSCALLLLVGLVPGAADVVRVLCSRSVKAVKRLAKMSSFVRAVSGGGDEDVSRSNHWCQGISAMTFAWCIHFAVDWWVASHTELEGSQKAVLSALAVTLLSFLLIFGLDKVADMHFDDQEVDRALRGMISGLGLLVGFSWERCFDASVEGLADHRYLATVPPLVNRLVFSTFLAAMVLPAWKWYILPMLYQFHNAHNEHSHALVEEPTKKPKALLHRLGSEISMISDEIKNPRLLSRLGSEISMLSDEMKNPRLLKRRGSEISTTSDDAKGWKCFSREGSVSLLTA